jgi:hypothetical protein
MRVAPHQLQAFEVIEYFRHRHQHALAVILSRESSSDKSIRFGNNAKYSGRTPSGSIWSDAINVPSSVYLGFVGLPQAEEESSR